MYDYEAWHKKYPVNQHDDSVRHAAVASLVRGRVLDVGCGTGNLSDYYFGPYVGVDIADEAVRKAKEVRRSDARFFACDPTLPEISLDEKFDTVVMSEFLEHLEDEGELFENIDRLLVPGGRIVITVPNFDRIPCDEHVRTFTIPVLREKLRPLGDVRFYNWAGAEHQILCTVDTGRESRDLLSLVMVVKNEEKGLERAILSAIEHVDKVVVAIDRSSTDQTLALACMYADVVKFFGWSDDFSAARNFAHDGVTTPWIFFLDGHEYLESAGALEKHLAFPGDGLMVSVQLESGFVFHNPRVYRNGLQFQGKVHEKQNCKKTMLCTDVLVKHDRLGGSSPETAAARDRQRDDMVPRIMGEELRKHPGNVRALFHLGLYWQSKGCFVKALSFYRRYLRYSRNVQERWFVLFHQAMCFLALGKNFRAFYSVSRAEVELPGRWETAKLKGMILFFKKKYSQALECFVKSFDLNSGPSLYQPWKRDVAHTWNLIGECFFNLGDLRSAHVAFCRAAEFCTDKMLSSFYEKRAALVSDILAGQNAPKAG